MPDTWQSSAGMIIIKIVGTKGKKKKSTNSLTRELSLEHPEHYALRRALYHKTTKELTIPVELHTRSQTGQRPLPLVLKVLAWTIHVK